eukprot:COSAG05_NODE_2962_length_2460_cov_1.737399_5_plen_92_part_01
MRGLVECACADSKIFNPLADWSWEDIITYVNENDVPVNSGHNFVYRAASYIEPTERHLADLPWEKSDLGACLRGSFACRACQQPRPAAAPAP